jgi:hypothetical protein
MKTVFGYPLGLNIPGDLNKEATQLLIKSYIDAGNQGLDAFKIQNNANLQFALSYLASLDGKDFAKDATLAAIKNIDGIKKIIDPVTSKDTYPVWLCLSDQDGANDVLTFTFARSMDLIWALSVGPDLVARATSSAQTPSPTLGVKLFDGVPQPITNNTNQIKVYAPQGTVISVWGYAYA